MDRTQWQENNILMVSAIYQKRAFPIFWILLPKKGSSDLREQQTVLRPVIKLFKKTHKVVIIGDREFHSVDLAQWIHRQEVKFVLRQKKDTSFRQKKQKFKSLSTVQIAPGQRQFLSEINITQKKGFGRFNLAVYWKRKYKGKPEKAPWYLLTNFSDLEMTLMVYQKCFGIEAMFKDCKTGGYNLEGSKASSEKLSCIVLLIALAMTAAWLQGARTVVLGKYSYICCPKEPGRAKRRDSNFWIGLYGYN